MIDITNKLKKAGKAVSNGALKLVSAVTASSAPSPVVTLSESRSFAAQVKAEDTIYVVKYDFDLEGESVTLPKGCTLEFKGGSLKNGVLVGQDSVIHADRRIFHGVSVRGTWSCVGNAGWFADGTPIVQDQWGCRFPKLIDQSGDLQQALCSTFRELHFPPMCFYIANTLVLTKEKKIVLHGSDMKLSLYQTSIGKMNTAVIFSDQNICLLRIAVNETQQNTVYIEGGSFDVSLCANYTENCIEVRADEEGQCLWGLTLNTNVKGRFNQTTGVGININPVANYSLTGNKAYVTQVRINSNVSCFGIGVKATDHTDDTMKPYNWCSDLVVDGSIIDCPVAVESNCDSDIRAMIQSGKFFDKKENGVALIRLTSNYTSSVSSNIFDIRQTNGEGWSNEYAVEQKGGVVTADGKFRAFYLACEKMGWPIVKGKVYGGCVGLMGLMGLLNNYYYNLC